MAEKNPPLDKRLDPNAPADPLDQVDLDPNAQTNPYEPGQEGFPSSIDPATGEFWPPGTKIYTDNEGNIISVEYPTPPIPEIGAADFSGVIGPDWGLRPPDGEDTPPPPAGDAAGDGDGIANEYGDGPDLDGNGIPDEIGINPYNQQPGYPGMATQPPGADTPPAPPSGEGEYQDQDVPPLQFGNTANLTNRLDPNAPYNPEDLSERREETLEKTLEKYGDDDVNSRGNSGGPIEVDPDQEKTLEKYGDEPDQEVPEIGMIPTGMIAPEFPGPLPPVGEDTPPPPGEPGETPPQQPDELIEFRDVPSGGIPNSIQHPQGIDPNLLDPTAPGPTLDTGLVDRITQSPELVDRVNKDLSVAEALERDPTQINQIEQYLGIADHQRPMDPSGDSSPSFTDPSFTDPGSAGQDAHEHEDGFDGVV